MQKNNRIFIVDALRGFALLMIILIHFVEHFEFFKQPAIRLFFSAETDRAIMEWTFAMISGKAYSIFALLFGLSFFIQLDNKRKEGTDYHLRFLWRLCVLFAIGFVHSLIYRGDILHVYALLAIPLVFLDKLNVKALIIIAILLLLQLPIVYKIIQSFTDSSFVYQRKFFNLFREGNTLSETGSLTDVISFNFWKGRLAMWSWTYYNGRYMQLIALFIIGLILGRKRIFENIANYKRAFTVTVFIGIAVFLVLYYVGKSVDHSACTNLQKRLLNILIDSYSNMAVTIFLVSGMVLIYLKVKEIYLFKLFAAYGKNSLTNYTSQAIFGVIFFYGFGFAMYQYFGSTWSILFGFVMFFTQAFISIHWNKHFKYGPVEWFWRCCTLCSFRVKFKK